MAQELDWQYVSRHDRDFQNSDIRYYVWTRHNGIYGYLRENHDQWLGYFISKPPGESHKSGIHIFEKFDTVEDAKHYMQKIFDYFLEHGTWVTLDELLGD